MREDYIEQLEKMFPEGYVLLYTCPNNTIRLGYLNPEGIEELVKLKEYILENSVWEDGGEIK